MNINMHKIFGISLLNIMREMLILAMDGMKCRIMFSAVLVEPISGRLATDSDTKKKMMYFIKGTEPTSSEQEVFDEKVDTAKAN